MLLLMTVINAVVGHGAGAPISACFSITPSHGDSTATGPVPFIVDISSLDDGYTGGEIYTSKPWLLHCTAAITAWIMAS